MKQLLQTLTPAESLLLRKGDITPQFEMLKLTLMDLLLKKVLVIQTEELQSNSRDPVRTLQYVTTGENFKGYAALPHELAYLSDFQKSKDLRMSFRDCVRVGFENSESEKKMRDTVRSTPALTGAFEQSFLQKLIGGFDYTDQGFAKRLQLENEIRRLEDTIPKLMQTNRAQALDELKMVGGNIFLLHGLGLVMLADIEREFFKNAPVYETTSGCGGCGTIYSNDFDGSYPSDSDSGDSGCSSGDGGCSGCGGD